MPKYSHITIIYNPNSTGSSEKLARELKHEIVTQLPNQPVSIAKTNYAGHAEKIAYRRAKATPHPLIISSSGDGGYHEVINGLLRAQREGAKPTSGLLPSGNANDHYHSVHDRELIDQIKTGSVQQIDLLHLSATIKGRHVERYAHSYIGLGLTPKVGAELNKTKLNRLNEIGIVLRVLVHLRATRLKVEGKVRSYDSLVFSNVPKMSKVFELSKSASVSDGQFEITALMKGPRLQLIKSLLQASTAGLSGEEQTTKFEFETVRKTLMQLDGEIVRLDAHSVATVTIAPHVLRCIV